MSLTATLHADRAAALEAARTDISAEAERERTALQKQIVKVKSDAEARIAEAERQVEKRRLQLAAQLLEAFHAAMTPLVKGFMFEPSRRAAVSIAECWAQFDARAQGELGAPLHNDQVAVAFADQLLEQHPNGAVAFGQDRFNDHHMVEILGCFRRATEPRAQQEALEDLEQALRAAARAAGAQPASPRLAARYTVKRTCATHADARQALSAFDNDQEKRDQAEFDRRYKNTGSGLASSPIPGHFIKPAIRVVTSG